MEQNIDYNQIEKQLEEMLCDLQKYSHIYIYTAGNRAKEVLQMCKLGYLSKIRIAGFIVTGRAGSGCNPENPMYLDGKKVYLVEEFFDKDISDENAAVWVTTMEHYHTEIEESLQKTNFRDVYYLTDALERMLVDNAVKWYFEQQSIPYFYTGHESEQKYQQELEKKNYMLFRVQSAVDAPLQEARPEYSYVTSIQAGAALAEQKVCDVTDMEGDNISDLNSYYNELSCLYWIWKNTNYEYSGICHYRRMFESDVAFRPILEEQADVVLASPCIVYPDLKEYYLGWGEKVYYEEMLKVLSEFYPDYYDTACWCADHPIFIPYNISILKREVLEEYCEFMFKILFEVEERINKLDVQKQKRCWLSEHVSTIYFMHHLKVMKDYKIYFSDIVRYW